MKKFTSKLVFVFSLFIVVNLLFFVFLSRGGWISPIEKIKVSFFNDSIKNPIYVIAGSSMGNSFDSEFVSKKMKREVFNTSFSLAHKSSFLLNYISSNVKKGDIVVYGPEYDHYYDFDNSISMSQSASVYNNTSFFNYLAFNQKIKFLLNIPKMNILLSYKRMKMLLKPQLFNKTTYSKRGDYIDHLKDKKTWKPSKKTRYERNQYQHKMNMVFKENLLKSKSLIEKKGARLFITFPPHPKSEFDKRFTIDLLQFYKNTKFKLIGKPDSFVFHDSLFLNHPYHTTYSGTKKRTEIFIKNLEPFLSALDK
mgnify:CR=1 FL=1